MNKEGGMSQLTILCEKIKRVKEKNREADRKLFSVPFVIRMQIHRVWIWTELTASLFPFEK